MSGMVVCIDLGGTKALCGLAKKGRIAQVKRYPVPASGTKQEVTNYIMELVKNTITDECVGIAIGIPGVVNSDTGEVFEVTNIPAWRDVQLSELLCQRFNVPVLVHNDVNCFTYGEYRYGEHGRVNFPCKNILGVCLGTGLGAGVVINKQLYTGRYGLAGEFGSAPYLNKTIEDYCSGQFFKQRGTDGELEYLSAKAGNTSSLKLFEQLGTHLGIAFAHMQLAYDPDVIVMGGSVTQSYDLFGESMVSTFTQYEQCKQLNIRISQLPYAPLLGAFALFEQKYHVETSAFEHA
ncbi:ROK family protein [Pseudoalteromonas umbrosa]|uniref:ROK family protein n=1 Tax=Pseudoalteromonas umbrosa TaxID=3048489 RepID=UPI0024C2DD17|nr:ROK family protein [Pseudoalteromonas sp. B95]MDK1288208.1 ROK family protein [Pseudoalteromonas sp. B95]